MNIGIPECCPICNGKLEIRTSAKGVKDLFCVNEQCPSRFNEQVSAFCDRLNIMGVSNTTLENWGIKTIQDIVDFKPNPAYKSEVKFAAELDKKLWMASRKKVFLVLSAFIPGIGEKEMEKFNEKFHILETDFACPPQVSSYVKEKVIIDNLEKVQEGFRMIVEDPRYKGVEEVEAAADDDGLGTICFTGKLETMTRSVAQEKAKKLGYKIADGVSKELGTLVVADAGLQGAPSSKLKKARQLGITIMSETEFNNL